MAAATTPNSAGSYLGRALSSALGAKVLMAVSGLLFYGWLVLHLLGNISIFAGSAVMNEYAHLLASKPALLWGQRIGLLAVVLTHVVTAIKLSAKNRAARPQPYASPRRWRQASLASRTMLVSGLVVLAFLVMHLLHFTVRAFESAALPTAAGLPDVAGMVIHAFSNPAIAIGYVVSVGFIGFHLSHAVWSASQTLGFTGPRVRPATTALGLVMGVGLAALFCLIPLAGLAGLLK